MIGMEEMEEKEGEEAAKKWEEEEKRRRRGGGGGGEREGEEGEGGGGGGGRGGGGRPHVAHPTVGVTQLDGDSAVFAGRSIFGEGPAEGLLSCSN